MAIPLTGNVDILRIWELLEKVLSESDLANYSIAIDNKNDGSTFRIPLDKLKLLFQGGGIQVLSSSGNITQFDTNLAANSKITLTENTTITLSNLIAGDRGVIIITQGIENYTVAIDPMPYVVNEGAGVVIIPDGEGARTLLYYFYDGNDLNIDYSPNKWTKLLGQPILLEATMVDTTSIKLDWINGTTDQDGTYIYISTDGINFTNNSTALGLLTTKTITGLTNGTIYYFKVIHYKGTELGDYSNTVIKYTFYMTSNVLVEGDSIALGLSTGTAPIINAHIGYIPGFTLTSLANNAVIGNKLTDVITRVNAMGTGTIYKTVIVICGWNDCVDFNLNSRDEAYIINYVNTNLDTLYNALKTKTDFNEFIFSLCTKGVPATDAGLLMRIGYYNSAVTNFIATKIDMFSTRGDIVIDGTDARMCPDTIHPGYEGRQLQCNAIRSTMQNNRGIAFLTTLESAEIGQYRDNTIELRFNKYLYKVAPDISCFTVSGTSATISSISIPTSYSYSIYLTLDSTPLVTDTITISYTKGATTLKDIFLNEIDSISNQPVTNTITTNASATFVSGEVGELAANILVTNWSKRMDWDSVPDITDFTLSGMTNNPTVTDVEIVNRQVKLTLSDDVIVGDTPLLNYTSGTNPLRDTGMYEISSFTNQAITNNYNYAYEATSSTFKSAVLADSGIVIDYLMVDKDIKKLTAESLLTSCAFIASAYGGIKVFKTGGVQDGVMTKLIKLYDYSGNARHFSSLGSAERYPYHDVYKKNLLELLTFNGLVNNFGATVSSILQNVPGATIIIVKKANATQGTTATMFYASINGNSFQTRLSTEIYTSKNRVSCRALDADATKTVISSNNFSSNWNIHSSVIDYVNRTVNIYQNNVLDVNGSITTTAGNTSNTTSDAVVIGAASATGNSPFKGDIGLLAVFNRVLNDTERNNMENYFAEIFGITI